MDVSRMHALGFAPTIPLDAGIAQMIDLYAGQKEHA
jgi:nucleoside-diphosphate-sugar epimerase